MPSRVWAASAVRWGPSTDQPNGSSYLPRQLNDKGFLVLLRRLGLYQLTGSPGLPLLSKLCEEVGVYLVLCQAEESPGQGVGREQQE